MSASQSDAVALTVPVLPALSPIAPAEQPSGHSIVNSSSPATFTHKEWVVPPRPRPGRKPASDVPPTKRKAQNRAAQRAFRERRAAKVGELEGQMKEQEANVANERNEMKSLISRLETSVEHFKGEVLAWQRKCQILEQGIEGERTMKESAERKILELERMAVVQQRSDTYHHYQTQDPVTNAYTQVDEAPVLVGCGNCTKDTRCECIEQVLNLSTAALTTESPHAVSKRPHSPEGPETGNKRQQSENEIDETDFTSLYHSNDSIIPSLSRIVLSIEEPTSPATVRSSGPAVRDPCGFCQDGTHCVCSQLEQPNQHDGPRIESTTSQFTPPPAEGDVCPYIDLTSKSHYSTVRPYTDHPVRLNPTCASGPGTCEQCQSDPNSTLFCKSLAALRSRGCSSSNPLSHQGDCTANKNQGSTTCACRTASSSSSLSSHNPNGAVYLSCADTYTTLSRHRHYSEATDELDTWLGKLKTTTPLPTSTTAHDDNHPGSISTRPALEIEAASVMGVLKFFDRRFGSSVKKA